MKNCVLIIPYFGKFPSWFQLFLDSCGRNPGFEWLIYTDDATAYSYPENVHVHYTDFPSMQKRFREKLGEHICLERPYKFCDYRPAYGYVFAEQISQYRYWGHCDLDLIFGDLEGLVLPLIKKDYEKIFAAGHLTLYKNTEENNKRFLLPLSGDALFEKYSRTEQNRGFDEDGGNKNNVHAIYLENGFSVYAEDLSFNCSDKYYLFRQCSYRPDSRQWRMHPREGSAWFWAGGKLLQLTPNKKDVETREYAYMHFQGRKWMTLWDTPETEILWIRPDGFRYVPELPRTVGALRKHIVRHGGKQGLRMLLFRLRLRLGRVKIWLKGNVK